MPTIGPHTFSIVVNGRSLHEYEPPTNEVVEASEKKKVVYIEAVEGMNFEVHCKSQGRIQFTTGHIGIHLFFDDKHVLRQRLSKKRYHKRTGSSFVFGSISQMENWSRVERKFQFSDLQTTDTVPASTDLKQIARTAGTIRIEVYAHTAANKHSVSNSNKTADKAVIPEKALKGQPIDMTAGLGEPKPTTRRMTQSDSRRIGGPLLQCVFKYRSRKALQMLDLIPMTPEPIALHERDPNTLSLAEARELLSRIQRQASDTSVVKQENLAVKQEQGSQVVLDSSRLTGRKRRAGVDKTSSDDDDLIFVGAKRVKSVPTSQVEVLDLS